MPKTQPQKESPKRGRPATGKLKIKLSASASPALIAAATKMAYKRGESFSNYVARAIQTQLLNEQ
jgi:hypothetical protein